MKLDDHVVVVTGAGRGIGAAVAEYVGQQGARIALLGRSADQVIASADRLAREGIDAAGFGCDVSSDASVADAFAALRARFGGVTALVNNAGVIGPIGRLGETSPEEWAAVLNVNVAGMYRVTRAALPDLARSAHSVIVNVSSGAAERPSEGWSAYCSSRAASYMLTRVTALEYENIAVYGLRPGLVDTAMQESIRASGIGPISRVPRENLLPTTVPARAIAWLIAERPMAWRGEDADVRDEEFARAAGLPVIKAS